MSEIGAVVKVADSHPCEWSSIPAVFFIVQEIHIF